MAIVGSLLGTAFADTTNAQSYATGSVTPTANALVLVLVGMSHAATAPVVPAVTGNGITYALVDATNGTNGVIGDQTWRVSLFRGMNASPSAGAVTASITSGGVNATGCVIHVCQFTGVDTSGTNGSGAVVQVVKANGDNVADLTVTLAALDSASNAGFGAFFGNDILAAAGGLTQLGNSTYATPTAYGLTEWKLNTTAIVGDINGTKDLAGIAVEIAEAVAAAAQIPYRNPMPALIAQ